MGFEQLVRKPRFELGWQGWEPCIITARSLALEGRNGPLIINELEGLAQPDWRIPESGIDVDQRGMPRALFHRRVRRLPLDYLRLRDATRLQSSMIWRVRLNHTDTSFQHQRLTTEALLGTEVDAG